MYLNPPLTLHFFGADYPNRTGFLCSSGTRNHQTCSVGMVSPIGFEPISACLEDKCLCPLGYGDIVMLYYCMYYYFDKNRFYIVPFSTNFKETIDTTKRFSIDHTLVINKLNHPSLISLYTFVYRTLNTFSMEDY